MSPLPNFAYIAKMRDWKGDNGPTAHWDISIVAHALRLRPRTGEFARYASKAPVSTAFTEFKDDYLRPLFEKHGKDMDEPCPGDRKGLGAKTDEDGGNYNRPNIKSSCNAALGGVRGTETKYEDGAPKAGWTRKDHYARFIVHVVTAHCEPGGRWDAAVGGHELDWDESHLKMLCLLTAYMLDKLVCGVIYAAENWYDDGDRGNGANASPIEYQDPHANQGFAPGHEGIDDAGEQVPTATHSASWMQNGLNGVYTLDDEDIDHSTGYKSEDEPVMAGPLRQFRAARGPSFKTEPQPSRASSGIVKNERKLKIVRQKRLPPASQLNPRAHIKKQHAIKRER